MFYLHKKNLLIVAHPDDEVLFAYSAISSDSDWKIICCTNESNKIRCEEFSKVMKFMNLEHEILDFPDIWGGGFPEAISEKLVMEMARVDNVLTHNVRGEYGHSQHKALHSIVKKLSVKNMFCFGDALRPLSFRVLSNKIDILKMYDSQYSLNAYDWCDHNDINNNLMKYVSNEGFTQVK